MLKNLKETKKADHITNHQSPTYFLQPQPHQLKKNKTFIFGEFPMLLGKTWGA